MTITGEQYLTQVKKTVELLHELSVYAMSIGCDVRFDEITIETEEQMKLLTAKWEELTKGKTDD